jgi:hypothetical protein
MEWDNLTDIHESIARAMEKIDLVNKQIGARRMLFEDKWDIAEEFLGRPGRMLSGSKTSPRGQRIIWNANVCTLEHGKIWFGDLNVTADIAKLIDLSYRLNTLVYVLYEMDARFDAIVCVSPHGEVVWDKQGDGQL